MSIPGVERRSPGTTPPVPDVGDDQIRLKHSLVERSIARTKRIYYGCDHYIADARADTYLYAIKIQLKARNVHSRRLWVP